jgi:rhodanese-related sulfurtransferase
MPMRRADAPAGLSRRQVLLGSGGLVLAAAAGWALGGRNLFYAALRPDLIGRALAADVAYRMVRDGQLLLIDIRRPDEWSATGSPEGGIRLDMRRDDFTEALRALATSRPGLPVALICARGVRSARLANRLVEAGLPEIIDIPEGMLGSAAGPGWIARGLPVERGA